jgi:hypothetical protein
VATDDHRWAHRTPSLHGLSFCFGVRSDDEALGRHIDDLFAGLRAAGPVEHWYSLTATTASGHGDGIDITRDDEHVARLAHRGEAVDWLLWDVNRSVAEASAEHLLLHAGAVCRGGTGIVMPGPSGSGKSTLAAGLVRAGLDYLSDELVAVELASGRLLPYAKPITVKPGSFDALHDLVPADVPPQWRPAGERHVPVGAPTGRAVAGPTEAGILVVPRYEAGATTKLTPLSATEAFAALAVNAVNLTAHGSDAVRVLGQLAARCDCVALTTSDLRDACALVLGLAAARADREAARAS